MLYSGLVFQFFSFDLAHGQISTHFFVDRHSMPLGRSWAHSTLSSRNYPPERRIMAACEAASDTAKRALPVELARHHKRLKGWRGREALSLKSKSWIQCFSYWWLIKQWST